jgi:hypothetical protein
LFCVSSTSELSVPPAGSLHVTCAGESTSKQSAGG